MQTTLCIFACSYSLILLFWELYKITFSSDLSQEIVQQVHQINDYVLTIETLIFVEETKVVIYSIVSIILRSIISRTQITRTTQRAQSQESTNYSTNWVIDKSIFIKTVRHFFVTTVKYKRTNYYRFFLLKKFVLLLNSSSSSLFTDEISTKTLSQTLSRYRFRNIDDVDTIVSF